MAASTGVVDGGMTGIKSGWGMKFYEILKHISYWPSLGGNFSGIYFGVTKKNWEALPADLKPKVKEVFDRLSKWGTDVVLEEERDVTKNLEQKGAQIRRNADPAEIEKMKPYSMPLIKDWITRCEAKGFKFNDSIINLLKKKGIWAK